MPRANFHACHEVTEGVGLYMTWCRHGVPVTRPAGEGVAEAPKPATLRGGYDEGMGGNGPKSTPGEYGDEYYWTRKFQWAPGDAHGFINCFPWLLLLCGLGAFPRVGVI